jgi:hypothetical protein
VPAGLFKVFIFSLPACIATIGSVMLISALIMPNGGYVDGKYPRSHHNFQAAVYRN